MAHISDILYSLGRVPIPKSRRVAAKNTTGCRIAGLGVPMMSCGPLPLPCFFCGTLLLRHQPSRWAAFNIRPGRGNLFGVGLVGKNKASDATMTILWLSGGQMLVGRRMLRRWRNSEVLT